MVLSSPSVSLNWNLSADYKVFCTFELSLFLEKTSVFPDSIDILYILVDYYVFFFPAKPKVYYD